MYESADETRQKLANGVVWYKGALHYVLLHDRMGKDLKIDIAPLTNLDHRIIVSANDVETDKFPFGFVNSSSGRALYIARPPRRIYRKAVGFDSLEVYGVSEEGLVLLGRSLGMRDKDLLDSLEGKFPSFSVACKKLRDSKGPDSVAISQEIALTESKDLFFNYEIVGKVDLVNEHVILRKEREWDTVLGLALEALGVQNGNKGT